MISVHINRAGAHFSLRRHIPIRAYVFVCGRSSLTFRGRSIFTCRCFAKVLKQSRAAEVNVGREVFVFFIFCFFRYPERNRNTEQ